MGSLVPLFIRTPSHARDTILKVNEEFKNLLQTIRYKAYEESLQ